MAMTTFENASNEFKKLSELVERMRENKSKVPEQELKTRYKKSYRKLMYEIKESASSLFPTLVLRTMNLPFSSEYISEEQGNKLCNTFKEIIEDKQLAKEVGKALTKYCDIELFMDYVLLSMFEFERCFFMDYWLSFIQLESDGRYYHRLAEMWYSPEDKCWYNKNNEYNYICCYPTKEAFEAELGDDINAVVSEINSRIRSYKEAAVLAC